MQGAQATRFYFASASLADPIQALLEPLESLVNGCQFVPGRILDHLQRLVVLQLNGAVAGIADQGFILPLQIAYDARVTLLELGASSRQELLDPAGIALCYGHWVLLVCLGCIRKIAQVSGCVSPGRARVAQGNSRVRTALLPGKLQR